MDSDRGIQFGIAILQIRLAGQEALSKGVTSFHDAGSGFATIDFLKRLESEGKLPIRLYVMVRGESNEAMDQKLPQYLIASGATGSSIRWRKRIAG